MIMPTHLVRWIFWPTAVVLVLGTTFVLWRYSQPRRHSSAANAADKKHDETPSEDDDYDWTKPPDTTNVKTVRPRPGAMERITVQVGTVETDEVQLFAQVTGVLKKQTVDIGDRVGPNMLLAEVDVPELVEQEKRHAAVAEQARARVKQMQAKVEVAKADLEAEKAQIIYAEANARAATAWLTYRTLQLERMKYLAKKESVEEKLVDEAKERHEAARESENSAKAAIVATKAKVMSVAAKIDLAEADVLEAEAQTKVADADLAKLREQLKFAQIKAPFEGIITHRAMVPGGLVRSAALSGTQVPLLTIQRTDRMRMVVQIPDRDVPYADPGDPAYVEIDAFPGEKFNAKINRIAKTEHAATRLMPVEIDLPNPDKKIRQGMFGKVTIVLDKATDQLSIPSSCLAGKSKTREGSVFIERDGKSYRVKVKLGSDNGVRVEVLEPAKGETRFVKLKPTDRVILAPPRGLTDGIEVQATLIDETEPKEDTPP